MTSSGSVLWRTLKYQEPFCINISYDPLIASMTVIHAAPSGWRKFPCRIELTDAIIAPAPAPLLRAHCRVMANGSHPARRLAALPGHSGSRSWVVLSLPWRFCSGGHGCRAGGLNRASGSKRVRGEVFGGDPQNFHEPGDGRNSCRPALAQQGFRQAGNATRRRRAAGLRSSAAKGPEVP